MVIREMSFRLGCQLSPNCFFFLYARGEKNYIINLIPTSGKKYDILSTRIILRRAALYNLYQAGAL